MSAPLLTEGVSNSNPTDIGKASRKRLRERAVEIAALEGRTPQDAGKSDWEQAKHELNGDPESEVDTLGDSDVPNESDPAGVVNTLTQEWIS